MAATLSEMTKRCTGGGTNVLDGGVCFDDTVAVL